MSEDSENKQIEDFVQELTGFAQAAEDTLHEIDENKSEKKHLFSFFSEKMFTIRGTCQQLQLPHIVSIAELAEEIALKATQAQSRSQIRKCMGSLWDAMTTIKYLIQHHQKETTEEQDILVNRLQYTLDSFGGAREKVGEDEIQKLLAGENTSSKN